MYFYLYIHKHQLHIVYKYIYLFVSHSVYKLNKVISKYGEAFKVTCMNNAA